MKNKNFRKLKYVSGDPQNAGYCTIYPPASGGLGGPQTPGLNLRQGSFTRKVRTIFALKIIVSIFVKLFLILVLHLRQFFIVRIFVKRATDLQRNQAYNEVKINPRFNRYLRNVLLKAYYKFFIAKIRLITKRILNPNNVFITQIVHLFSVMHGQSHIRMALHTSVIGN